MVARLLVTLDDDGLEALRRVSEDSNEGKAHQLRGTRKGLRVMQ